MLEKLRRGAAKILAMVLFGILTLSFAIWGIGDVVRSSNQGPIAEIGGTSISAQEFTSALQNRRQMLARQFGQPISPEQSRQFGIDANVLGELINGAAVGNYAEKLGMKLSDQTIAELVRADPMFQGPGKTFSRTVFDDRIRQAGFNEERYFIERRNMEIREQLSEALVSGVTAPDPLVETLYRFREETRAVRFFRLDPDKAPKAGEPDEKALKSLYETSKAAFTSPETRTIGILLATPDQLKDRAKVSDEDVRKAWEDDKDAWNIPERRRIQQISFPSKEDAETEQKAIEGGKSFLLAALEVNGAQGRVDQGLIARREISDENFAQTAFSLPLNKVSEPLKVRGGWLLLRVSGIEAGKTRTFDEVKSEVRQSLEDAKARDLANNLHEEVEDKLGASDAPDKLKAVAEQMHLKFVEATGVNAKGLKADGSPAFDLPDAGRFIASAFEGDATTPRDTISLTGGGEAWIGVRDVKPAQTKPFEEVKGDVEKLWREGEKRAALAKIGQELVDKIKAGTSFDDVAKEQGVPVKTTTAFNRSGSPDGLSPAAARLAFTLAKGGAGTAATPDNASRIVMVVSEITAAPTPTKEQLEVLRNQLTQEFQRDTLQTMISAIRAREGVKINEAVYKRAVGLDDATQ